MDIPAGKGMRAVWLIRDSAGGEYRNIFTYYNANVSTATVEPTDVQSWAANLWDQVDDYISSAFSLYGVKLEGVGYFATETVSFTPVFAGADVNDRLPNQVAGLVTGYSDKKRGIAKKYIVGVCENGITNGLVNATYLAALQNFGDTWIEPFDLGAMTLTAGVYDESITTWYPIKSAIARTVPSTQRRRRAGVGI